MRWLVAALLLAVAAPVARAQPPTDAPADTAPATDTAPADTAPPPDTAPAETPPAESPPPGTGLVRLFAFLSGGFAGHLVNASDPQPRTMSTWPSFGGGLGGELRVHRYFAAGLRGRFDSYKPSEGDYLEGRARSLDISLVPRGLLPVGAVELYAAVPFGLTVDWLPDLFGARAGAGVGFHVAPVLGLRVWGEHVGWLLEAGYGWHWVHHSLPLGSGREAGLDFRRGEVIVSTGVAVRFP